MSDDPSRARARHMIGRAKEKVAQFRQLGEAAGAVDVEQLVERGLGMLLDDVLGPAKEQAQAPRVTESIAVRAVASPAEAPRGGDPVCIATAHGHMAEHFARLPGCVRGPE